MMMSIVKRDDNSNAYLSVLLMPIGAIKLDIPRETMLREIIMYSLPSYNTRGLMSQTKKKKTAQAYRKSPINRRTNVGVWLQQRGRQTVPYT